MSEEILLNYKDDYNECYSFKELVKAYNKLYSREEVKMRKVYGDRIFIAEKKKKKIQK
jgi:hypothetical protein